MVQRGLLFPDSRGFLHNMYIKERPTESRVTPGDGIGAAGEAPEAPYRMEEVVRRTGLTPRAIRYYEEVGLLTAPTRTAGGFRLFSEADVAKLQRIKELQSLLGFSLAEIKQSLYVDAVRAELRQAYEKATDAGTRLGIIDRGTELIQSQVRIIDERVARLMRLRSEYAERLGRLRTMRAQILEDRDAAPAAGRPSGTETPR
jgi:DNA-binding transcriptional MerR regulator